MTTEWRASRKETPLPRGADDGALRSALRLVLKRRAARVARALGLSIATLGGRVVSADIAGKSLRKARATIVKHGVDHVAVLIQGKLIGDAVTEAGLVAQVKAPAS